MINESAAITTIHIHIRSITALGKTLHEYHYACHYEQGNCRYQTSSTLCTPSW